MKHSRHLDSVWFFAIFALLMGGVSFPAQLHATPKATKAPSVASCLRDLKASDKKVRKAATARCKTLGKEAIAPLRKLLRVSKHETKLAILVLLIRMGDKGQQAMLSLVDSKFSYYTLRTAFTRARPASWAYAPLLRQRLQGSDKAKVRALTLLRSLREKAPGATIKAVAPLLQRKTPTAVSRTAIGLLSAYKKHKKLLAPLVPGIGGVAADAQRNGYLRRQAAGLLRDIGIFPKAYKAEFLRAYQDAKRWYRPVWLGVLALEGKPALPMLLKALKSSVWGLRNAAVKGMKHVGVDALPHLLKMWKKVPKAQAVDVIKAMGQLGAPAVPHLVKFLKDPSRQIRAGAVYALRDSGTNALPYIKIALQDPSRQVRSAALWSIGRNKSKAATELLVSLLKDKRKDLRTGACRALRSRKRPASIVALVPALLKDAKSFHERSCYVQLLKGFKTLPPALVAQLEALHKTASPHVRRQIVDVLLQDKSLVRKMLPALYTRNTWSARHAIARHVLGLGAAALLPFLKKNLQAPKRQVRQNVVYTLKMLRSAEADALLISMLQDKHSLVVRDAARALSNRGEKAFAALKATYAGTQDGTIRRGVLRALAAYGKPAFPILFAALQGTHRLTQRVAMELLVREGAPPAKLIPLLMQIANQKRGASYYARRALSRLLSNNTSTLLEMLKHPNAALQRAALQALKQSKANPQAVPVLRALLGSKQSSVQKEAAYALVRYAAYQEQLWPAFLPLLQSKTFDVRYAATSVLPRFGAKHPKMLELLLQQLQDKNSSVSYAAARGFRNAGRAALPLLARLLKKPSKRLVAVRALRKMRRFPKELLPAVLAPLASANTAYQQEVLWVLDGQRLLKPAVILPPLRIMLQSKDSTLLRTSLRVLGKLREKAKPALPAMCALVNHANKRVRRQLFYSLGRIRLVTTHTLHALLSGVQDTYPPARHQASRALKFVNAPTDLVAAAYSLALQNPDFGVYYNAARQLSKLRPSSATSNALFIGLRHSDAFVRHYALKGLARGGVLPPKLCNPLLKQLQAPERWLRYGAAAAIAKTCKDSIPALLGLVKKQDAVAAPYAALTLGLMGSQAQAALELLRNASNAKDPDLQFFAREAIANIQKTKRQ